MNFAIMTDATCGDACWAAREDICRCSCSGKNHGITRTPAGVAPKRTRRVKSQRYELLAVESYIPGDARIASLRPIEKLEAAVNGAAHDAGLFDRYASTWPDTPVWPCILRLASPSNVKGWPELAAWRGATSRPYVAWVREDMAHLVADTPQPEPEPQPDTGRLTISYGSTVIGTVPGPDTPAPQAPTQGVLL